MFLSVEYANNKSNTAGKYKVKLIEHFYNCEPNLYHTLQVYIFKILIHCFKHYVLYYTSCIITCCILVLDINHEF